MKYCKYGFFLAMLLVLSGSAIAATEPARGPIRNRNLDLTNPNIQNRVQDAGNVWMNIANWAYFGNDSPGGSEGLSDPCTGEWAPQCEFPAGSGQQYLYMASLWVGAIIVGDTAETMRVSVGTNGWIRGLNELYPGEGTDDGIEERSRLPDQYNCFGVYTTHPEAVSDMDLLCTYSDTLTDPFWVSDDPDDGPHNPLGLEIQQRSRAWGSIDFGDFIIVEYQITNIGEKYLKDVYLGLYVDSDVGNRNENNWHTDDIAGLLAFDPTTGDTVNIAYIADNNGWGDDQPMSGEFTVPHVLGTYVLVPPEEGRKFSFNWWVSNGDVLLDYGPAWESYAETDSMGMGWTCDYGTPMGDVRKYQVMSSGEIDFDQIMTDRQQQVPPQEYTDPFTGEHRFEAWSSCGDPWIFPNIADGYDARYLMSWGPLGVFDYTDLSGQYHFRLNPGEEFSMTLAFVLGRDFHDPHNPQIPGQPIDSSKFDFTGLLRTARMAKLLFDTEYIYEPPVPPGDFSPVTTTSGQVELAWSTPEFGTVSGYNVFGIDDAGAGTQIQFNTSLVTETAYIISDLDDGSDWLFRVQTVDDSGFISTYADTLVRVAAPFPITGLFGETENGTVWLHWNPNSEANLTGYRVIRRYLNYGDSTSTSFEVTRTRFMDDTALLGRLYSYTVVAENDLGISSLIVDSVTLRPMAPARRILIIDDTNPTNPRLGGVSDDSVNTTYDRILNELGEGYDRIEQSSVYGWQFSTDTLAHYDLVIWHSEDRRRRPSISMIYQREQVFRDYLAAGGRLLRIARQLERGKLHFSPGMFYGNYEYHVFYWFLSLDLDSVFVTYWNPSDPEDWGPAFIGATADMSGFPNVEIDTAKVNALQWASRHYNFLPEIDLLWPRAPTQVLYRAVALPEDTSGFDNEPCAVMGQGQIVLAFPLYLLEEDDATQLMQACITTLRSMDVEPPQLSLGVVQNPVETSYLDIYLVSNEDLMIPFNLLIAGTDSLDSVETAETASQSLVYHADWQLTENDTLTISASVCDSAGNCSDVSRSFYSYYISPGGPAVVVTSPGNVARLALPANACPKSGYMLFYSEQTDEVNALSPEVTITPASWTLNHPAMLTIRCDVAANILKNKSVVVARRDGGKWVPVSSPARIEGNSVTVEVDKFGTYAVFEGLQPPIPLTTALWQNYPNPFNPTTTIRFDLAGSGQTRLVLYNILGQEVRVLVDSPLKGGVHQITWDGANQSGQSLGSGIYFARLEAPDGVFTIKLALIR